MNLPGYLEVVGTIYGYWAYHLAPKGETQTLCGREDIISTNVPLSSWGVESDPMRQYCSECEEMLRRL